MNICNLTDGQLAELLGIDATDDDARVMRGMLVELGFQDTTAVPDPLWDALLIAVAKELKKVLCQNP